FFFFFKGSDLGSIFPQTGQLVRFFHPRIDRWVEHFVLDGLLIVPRSEVGVVTARILDFNSVSRVLERQILRAEGRFPSDPAMKRLQ
ncbi:MAG: HNH endonuclease, partial [bacterium]|nr:HNH endonuclease [bacterium]